MDDEQQIPQEINLNGDRLALREMTPHDLSALTELLADPRQVRYIEFESTESSARCILDWSRKTAQEHPRTAYSLALTLPHDTALIGTCSLVIRDVQQREGHLGIILNRRYQGKGLAVEAGRLMLALSFEKLGLHRVCAGCHADNRASLYAMEKAGMRREAHFRESRWEKGKWNDWLVYALLDREWSAATQSVTTGERQHDDSQ